jgi:disulfide bond formation protein DsbB
MPDTASDLLRSPVIRTGGLVLLAATAVILAALAFEYIGGYVPCPLCLQQRYAYYLGIPALLVALGLAQARQAMAAAAVFVLVGVAFLGNAGLGTYQAGAEWKFWEPPASCAAPSTLPTFDFKRENFDRIPASCGVASWRLLGLSFAGWNAVASVLLAAGALAAARTAARPHL